VVMTSDLLRTSEVLEPRSVAMMLPRELSRIPMPLLPLQHPPNVPIASSTYGAMASL
jgi:hypothetical protein